MTNAADTPVNPDALKAPLETLLSLAKQAGASSADAVATHGRSLSISVRGGEIEDVDSSEGKDVGLRVMVGQRQACVSSSDLSKDSLERLAERAVAMAKLAPEDPYCGLAPTERLTVDAQDLGLFDPAIRTPAQLQDKAQDLEDAALAVKGVSQANGASAGATSSAIFFATSDGFAKGWRSTRHSMSVVAIAENESGMERDYDYTGERWLCDTRDAADIGRIAGERAVARLGGTQLKSGKLPVMFDRRVSASLVSALTGAISGPSVSRGVSFLVDKVGEGVFASDVNITDNPLMNRGNLIMQNGPLSPDALRADMGEGLLVTDMFGPSLNANTGDYSVGVSGFRIENGVITTPVTEVTVAGNLIDIYKNIRPANDLRIEGATAAPSLLLGELAIAGA